MSKAVRFDRYGDIEVLEVREVPKPVPAAGEAVVAVRAAGTNPGEAMIRKGLLHERWPATFPSGQGTDFAGVVDAVGSDVTAVKVGDEVVGYTHSRSSQAEFVSVPVEQLIAKPSQVSWEVAGGLAVAGTTAHAAVRAVALEAGDTVAVAGAAGGVGSIATQLARLAGATVLGIAGPSNDQWLAEHGIVAVNYGPALAERLRAAAPEGKIDAFLDFFGGGYADLAVSELGIAPQRVDTIIDFEAIDRLGIKGEGGAEADPGALPELVGLIATGKLDVPVPEVFPLDEVQKAYRRLEQRHTRGKIVLRP